MPQFRKKPVVVEAWRFTGQDRMDWPEPFASSNDLRPVLDDHKPMLVAVDIPTLEGTMRANKGDWIIRGVKGELYPCRDDIFREIYEEVAPEPAVATAEIHSLAQARANRDDDNSGLTVADNLEATLAAVKEGRMAGGQSIILLLDRESDEAAYNIIIRTSKLRRSESLALLHASAALLVNRLIGTQ